MWSAAPQAIEAPATPPCHSADVPTDGSLEVLRPTFGPYLASSAMDYRALRLRPSPILCPAKSGPGDSRSSGHQARPMDRMRPQLPTRWRYESGAPEPELVFHNPDRDSTLDVIAGDGDGRYAFVERNERLYGPNG